jgi:hypothetical protein
VCFQPLLKRPKPFFDESIRGYLIRLAHENWTSTKMLYTKSDLGIGGNQPRNLLMITEKADIQTLCEMVNLKEEELLNLTLFENTGKYADQDIKILRHLVAFGTCKIYNQVCPLCLNEQPYLKKIWEIKHVTTCHVHSTLLLVKCPKCKSNISAYRNIITHCQCGFDLRKCPIQKVSYEETGLSSFIYEKLFGLEQDIHFPQPFKELSFRHFLLLLLMFCYYSLQSQVQKSSIKYSEAIDPSKIHELVQRTYKIFYNWPESFYEFMNEFRTIQRIPQEGVLLNEFGNFYRKILRDLDYDVYRFIFDEFTNYCKIHESEEPSFATLKEKVSYLIHNSKTKQQCQAHVRPSSNESYIHISDVALRLGINLLVVRKLIQNNILEAKETYKTAKGSTILCSMNSVEKIIQTFNKRIKSHSEIDVNNKRITFREAVNQFKVYGLNICDLIGFVMQKRLTPCDQIDANGLHQFLFYESDVRNLIKGDQLILREVVKELGSPQPSVRSWIEKGFLEATQLKNRAFVISRSNLNKFKREYISLPWITKIHPFVHSNRAVYLWLKKNKIYPVSGQNDSGKEGLLYKKTPQLLKLIGL